MTRRPGLSLAEVLVALFIMGIGTIAILTLFPLGALNMAQALRDSRTTQAAVQADGYLRAYVEEKRNSTGGLNGAGESWYGAFSDPGSTTVSKYLLPVGFPSYPVVIDPMGYIARNSRPNQVWIGDNGFGNGDRTNAPDTSALSRHTLGIVRNQPAALQPPLALRLCTLLDGMGYDKATGAPDTSSGTIDRDIRYNWLWILQKTQSSSQAKMTVVLFDRRAPMYAPAGSETVYTPSYAEPDKTQVSFAAGQVPPVQKGGWLLDATVVTADFITDPTNPAYVVPSKADGVPPPSAPPNFQAWVRNANFYRVASVTQEHTRPRSTAGSST
ncbi:prepilin-type N-terminal cleavage/methylation domain-containing protein [bacterium]|nr:prepilin-type N-terminal cleavage/methylation domain-containing protein [bacterium]